MIGDSLSGKPKIVRLGNILFESELWARGALTVLPQPQLQGASGTVISARFDGLVAGCLT